MFGTTPPHLSFCLLMVSGCFQELLELLLHEVFAGACSKRCPDAFIQEVLEEQEGTLPPRETLPSPRRQTELGQAQITPRSTLEARALKQRCRTEPGRKQLGRSEHQGTPGQKSHGRAAFGPRKSLPTEALSAKPGQQLSVRIRH